MSTKPIKFSVVVPACARPLQLAECLQRLAPSVQSYSSENYEVIVTDDSPDSSVRELVQGRFPWAQWTAAPRRGPATNRNHGAAQARFEWLAFIDDDCQPESGWLAAFAEAVVNSGEMAPDILEGRTYADRPRNSLAELAPLNSHGGYLWSCNLGVQVVCFKHLGGFDTGFPYAAMEDVDFARRARAAGAREKFVPSAGVCHPWRNVGGFRSMWAVQTRHFSSTVYFLSLHPEARIEHTPRIYLKNNARQLLRDTLPGLRRWRGRGWSAALAWHLRALVNAVALLNPPPDLPSRLKKSPIHPAPLNPLVARLARPEGPPLVSIVVTAYQREQFLGEALASALAQTFSDYEIIVSDNSNKPALKAICESFGRPDKIRYRSNPTSLGIARNIHIGISEARGRYIAILNDDDSWEPQFLEKLIAPLEADPRRVAAFSDHSIMDVNGVVSESETDANSVLYGRTYLPAGEVHGLANLILRKNGVPLAMAGMFRRDVLDLALLTPEIEGAYDLWISCILAASGQPFYYVPERLTRYRAHSQSETARRNPQKALPMIYLYEQLLQKKWFQNLRGLLQRHLAYQYFRLGRDLLWFGRVNQARTQFRKSLATAFDLRPIVAVVLSYAPRSVRFLIGLQGSVSELSSSNDSAR